MFISFSLARFPPSPCPLRFLFSLLSGPLFPPTPSVFCLLYIYIVEIVLCFLFLLSRPTHALLPHSFEQFLSLSLTIVVSLFVMFSSSCYVADLVHHLPLIENQDGPGGRTFLPFGVVLTGYPGTDTGATSNLTPFPWEQEQDTVHPVSTLESRGSLVAALMLCLGRVPLLVLCSW